MSTVTNGKGRIILERIARRDMTGRGFLPDFSADVLSELEQINKTNSTTSISGRDLRNLLWASIDNDDTLDLDQLTVAEDLEDIKVRILVAVADVDALVKKNSAIDAHARQNTTSVYTAGKTFPMLPERLSTDLTSLSHNEDRPALVIDIVINEIGEIQKSDIYSALVRNHAKLAYNSIAAWLEGKSPAPAAVQVVQGLADNLRIQDRIAQKLRARRHERGALELQTLESRPIFTGDEIQNLQLDEPNRVKEMIEDFMIAANDVTARFLARRRYPPLDGWSALRSGGTE